MLGSAEVSFVRTFLMRFPLMTLMQSGVPDNLAVAHVAARRTRERVE